jgi:hypothetical protein
MSIKGPNIYPTGLNACPDYRAHLPRDVKHQVAVEAAIVDWDGTEVVITCSCGTLILGDGWKFSFLEVEKAVYDHYQEVQ